MTFAQGDVLLIDGEQWVVLETSTEHESSEDSEVWTLKVRRRGGAPAERFPFRAEEGQSLIRQCYLWAKVNKGATIGNRIDAAGLAIKWGREEIGQESALWIPFVLQVLHEIYEDLRGEPLATEANVQLRGLVKMYGPSSTLDAMCQALAAGAGLDGGYEDDPRAVIKYAAKILSGGRDTP